MTNLTRSAMISGLAALVISAGPFAHGAHGAHIMGTLKSIDEKSIVVSTEKDGDQTIVLDVSTHYEKSGAAAIAKDLTVGERVVVHARKTDQGQVAEMVKFGTVKKAPRHGYEHADAHKKTQLADHEHPQ